LTEWRLFTGDTPHVSTLDFHAGRARAPHLEQPDHRARLLRTAELIHQLNLTSVVDLGCGDGGLLSLLTGLDAWGYDFSPINQAGWVERGVTAEVRDVFNARDVPRWGECAVATEVLEHSAQPHSIVEWIARHARYLVASSPHRETDQQHSDCHAWAWNDLGYRALIEPHFEILSHETVDWSQIITGRSRY
jgi:2-polyprenyl-3-methyl-5-hydroxy-6-metoxy-1,4-benzoquinol methylase